MSAEETKACNKCGEVKALSEFGKGYKRKDGSQGSTAQCKACLAEARRCGHLNMSDSYIRSLIIGRSGSSCADVTPEAITQKRNELIEKREERDRQAKGQKTCVACGEVKDLTQFPLDSRVRRDGTRSPKGRCLECDRTYHREYAREHADDLSRAKIAKKAVERYWSDPEKARASARAYNAKHSDRLKARRVALGDDYVRSLIRDRTGLIDSEITEEMIEHTRQRIHFRRDESERIKTHGIKTCSRCEQQKPLADFSKNGAGVVSWCKQCHSTKAKKERSELTDWYVKRIIRSQDQIPGELITNPMIEMKRSIIQLKRGLKNAKRNIQP